MGENKERNRRYVPLDFLKDKKIKYSLYLYMQRNSSDVKNDNSRYYYYNSIRDLSSKSGLSNQTVQNTIKEMKDRNLISEFKNNKGKLYSLNTSDEGRYILLNLEDEVFEKLINAEYENELKIYIYLKHLDKYFEKFSKNYNGIIKVSQEKICDEIGLKKNSRRNVSAWIENLERMGILSCEMVHIDNIKKQYHYTLKK